MPDETRFSLYRARCVLRAAMLFGAVLCSASTLAQTPAPSPGNKPERLEWFRDQGLGLFIHWSVDVQLGLIISHSLAGASDAYANRFYRELPQTFNPNAFDPAALARLARVAGFRYMVFTTKHHNGFCMWDTATTPFNIRETPYKQDITRQVFDAFRGQSIPVGAYFSPDDFLWLHNHGKPIQRLTPGVQPSANPGLLDLDQKQITELMTRYGPVSVVFFDGEAKGLRDLVWRIQPDAVVTRGALETPEQNVPGAPLPGAWEANMTLGTAWGHQPSDEHYKSAEEIIRTLIHIRARGGNLLLNIGPEADGSLPREQEATLRTLGSWMFVNSEAIYGTRPWVVMNEGNLWYTRSKDHHTLYVLVDEGAQTADWKRGSRREFVLKTVRAGATSKVSVLGQSDELVEYRPNLDAHSTLQQKTDGLHVSVVRAQRMRDSDKWPYPTVIKLTEVEEAFVPPLVATGYAQVSPNSTTLLRGSWSGKEDAPGAKFGFEYRIITGEDAQSRLHGWQATPLQSADKRGEYQLPVHLVAGEEYEFRSVLVHPWLTIYGQPVKTPSR